MNSIVHRDVVTHIYLEILVQNNNCRYLGKDREKTVLHLWNSYDRCMCTSCVHLCINMYMCIHSSYVYKNKSSDTCTYL